MSKNTYRDFLGVELKTPLEQLKYLPLCERAQAREVDAFCRAKSIDFSSLVQVSGELHMNIPSVTVGLKEQLFKLNDWRAVHCYSIAASTDHCWFNVSRFGVHLFL